MASLQTCTRVTDALGVLDIKCAVAVPSHTALAESMQSDLVIHCLVVTREQYLMLDLMAWTILQ
jgi:hypothetical protein